MTVNEIMQPGEQRQLEPDQLQTIADQIRSECSNFVKTYRSTGQVLYRAHPGSKGPLFKARSFERRMIRDSNAQAADLFDAILENMGIEARRRNSIFTTSDWDQATNYGAHVYVIVPTNSADFSWSRTQKDTLLTRSFLARSVYRTAEPNYTIEELAWIKGTVDEYIRRTEQQPNTLPDGERNREKRLVLNKLNQIKTSGYVLSALLDYDLSVFGDFARVQRHIQSNIDLMLRNTDVDKVQAAYQITDQNFDAALRSGHEVLIHGEYYAIEHDLYESFKFW
jgi:hypothetical protein